MSIKKYRLCLVLLLIVVLGFGVVVMTQMANEDTTYTDGIMVWEECAVDEEASL